MRLMNAIRAVLRLTLAAVRAWPSRPVDTLVTVLGFATVAGILAAVLAMAGGYRHIFDAAAQNTTAIVLSRGSNSEWNSSVPAGAVAEATEAPGVARAGSVPLIAEDLLGSMPVHYRGRSLSARIVVRGVSPTMFAIDKGLHLVKGRWFRPGLNEIVVGEAAEGSFRGLAVGDRVMAAGTLWTVVGVFSAGAQFFSSEAWTSLGSLQGAERRPRTYSSLYVELNSRRAFHRFTRVLSQNPRAALHVMRESTYFSHQASGMSKLIIRIGGFFTTMMAAAAVFGAMSTLLVMVEARRLEVATLRALGYPHGIVFAATLLEGSLLGSLGGIVGAAVVYLSLNGYAASTLGIGAQTVVTTTTPQVFFHFLVSGSTMLKAVLWSIAMGMAGGLYPAVRAARMPIAAALRDI
ncbi:ABC transporter permease [Metallibacterium sp.]|uniref:ABC transporter permease n=1 Tax=Metallibacterium sp. TaxID=2940281 RepID=UPI002631E3F8|nr:ABC transporter permease [Metallibacterium sp.]